VGGGLPVTRKVTKPSKRVKVVSICPDSSLKVRSMKSRPISRFDRAGGTGRGVEKLLIMRRSFPISIAARVGASIGMPGAQAPRIRLIGKMTRRIGPPMLKSDKQSSVIRHCAYAGQGMALFDGASGQA
jgi:hypothetical protein